MKKEYRYKGQVVVASSKKEAIEMILAAVNINKDYLEKCCTEKGFDFSKVKKDSREFVEHLAKGVAIPPKIIDKFTNVLTLMNIKSDLKLLDRKFSDELHDAIVLNKDIPNLVVQKINSDAEPRDLKQFIEMQTKKNKSAFSLPPEDLEIWERVKVYKDFGNYRWVYAVDKNGKIVGFIPSRITSKTMNHCGNEPSKQSGDEYWELRDKDNKAYLTVILNKGEIQEAKSYGNQNNRMAADIVKYVEWFYKSDKVKGVGWRYDNGYATDKNFSVSTIASYDKDFMKWCEEHKPDLIGKNEKLICKYSKEDPKKLTEKYLKNPKAFGDNNWCIYLAAVGGKDKLPLSEDDIIQKLIFTKKLPLEVFGNADVALLSDRIQRAYVKTYGKEAFDTLFDIMKQVNAFYVDKPIIKLLLDRNPMVGRMLIEELPERKKKHYDIE